ncbi:sigma-54-dependent Fis family transcriptional regulator [Pelagibacterium halotolerans]|uniref:sigma-54-dependent Fis family transcriptional regulator n=1 Tax=Pelagibacterium halotolerans TaxID=531813 RepID=UPI00384DD658
MHTVPSEADLAAARKVFLSDGTLPDGLVPDTILRSWQRCAASGLDMTTPGVFEPLDQAHLKELWERNERLRLLSRPELATLRTDAKSTDSVVILTDATGLVLDTSGSPDFAAQAARVALQPGVAWTETNTGTNAIGTAIVERRPVEVLGAEHFFEPHQILSCAAAPIIDPYGRLAGILDMSGHAAVHHVHAMGLVRLAAEQIEHRYFRHGFDHCTLVRFHKAGAFLGTPREAVLAFDGDRLVAANRRALAALGLDRSAFAAMAIDDIFEAINRGGGKQKLMTHSGDAFIASVQVPRKPLRRAVPRPAPAREPAPVYDPPTRAALDKAIKLVNADIPLLVTGETGTGKELFARQVHAACIRARKPFVAINCAALPEALIESELFGYAEGAFTGARRAGRDGLVRQADGGILFLDEIGDMPLALQSRLLRVLQDKEVIPLGGGKAAKVDFAVICATHQPLKDLVDAGRFRADLYFRIAQYAIALPPFREVRDKAHVIGTLWRQLKGETGGPITDDALEALIRYTWPGNFRQLVGTLRAGAALIEEGAPLDCTALPADIFAPAPADPGSSLDAITETAMRAALAEADGNVSRAARKLGIDRSTFYRRVIRKDRH